MIQNTRRAITWLYAVILTGVLTACGGGTANDQCSVLDPSRSSRLPGCAGAGTPSDTVAIAPLSVTLTDSAGVTNGSVAPDRPGILRARVRDGSGNPISGVAVQFTTTDKSAVLVPGSGSALTDSQGMAQVGLQAGAEAGGFTATAVATKGTATASGNVGYAVSFPTLTLSPLSIAPSPLAAGGTASLMVTVLDGAQAFAPAQAVSFTSPCAAAGKASISSPVTTVAGVASTSYIDKGCGGADTITATTSLGGVSVSQSGVLTVLAASAGQLAFVSAQPRTIALKGTGGPGRQESSTVTFKVLDQAGTPIAGTRVNFALSGAIATGGITLSPTFGFAGADGTVSTVVFGGTVNTPLRVVATIDGSAPLVTTVSDQLVVSTGVAEQNSFSLSTAIYNLEGASFDGCTTPAGTNLRVSLADHFHNPVPNGTAVSFTAEGGSVEGSCLTGSGGAGAAPNGECSVRFCSSNPRVKDGRVTVLAYALGDESYTEKLTLTNTINRYDQDELFDDLCEPSRNDSAISNSEANSTLKDSNPLKGETTACRTPSGTDVYIDSNGNGLYNDRGDGLYNGVLNVDPVTGQTLANNRSSTVHVRGSLVLVMSGSKAAITPLGASNVVALDHCVDGTPFANNPVSFALAIRDTNTTVFPSNTAARLGQDLPGNVLPAGTRIEFTTSNGKVISSASYTVPNTNETSAADVWIYMPSLRSDATQTPATAPIPLACTNESRGGMLTVKVTTPMGVVTEANFSVTD